MVDLDNLLFIPFFQSVFYNTHVTFLTRQAIYVLVMDITKALSDLIPTFRKDQDGLDIPDTSCPQSVAGRSVTKIET